MSVDTVSTKKVDADVAAPWHTLTVPDTFERLKSAPRGLSEAEAARRMGEHGSNELKAAGRISPWEILLEQFKNVLIVILIFATALSFFLGHVVEAVAITIILLFAVILGFIQEYRAERAIEALREMAAPTATTIRDDTEREVPARELVPGDVLLLAAGDKVPADVRLTASINLQAEESALTGESVAVEKHTDALDDKDAAVGDRKNMAYAGTVVTYGRGRAVVVATAMATEFGKIVRMLQEVESDKTPLQEHLDKVGRTLARAAFAVVIVIIGLGLMRGQPFFEMLIFGVALAVAVVPEALPAVVTISLAIGVKRMIKRNALVRRLPAVETLGSTSVICSDKTGTLTKDEMTVRRIYAAGQMYEVAGAGYEPRGTFSLDGLAVESAGPLVELLHAGALCSDARVVRDETDGRWHVKGDPTEGALVVAAAKAGLDKAALDREFPRAGEIPFSSETKRMTTLHETHQGGGVVAYAKGAPEFILDSCTRQLTRDGEAELSTACRARILHTAQEMASEALRVLAVAR
ncbi:MAG TPA: HAD-IC family P-type ATPase, partial [Pyrinomonadaceae bacterium]|nr:HAD-IC family P-type ATPase [Pyrinomonadaceae bacterium]